MTQSDTSVHGLFMNHFILNGTWFFLKYKYFKSYFSIRNKQF